ncbi:hypothetical protein AVEN_143480-1 [Araneus ventricosus]|uniref:Uncharacterized protein n=1 Tax=Araneus ventricosus TaxID=182803 RepID=A0A4Y2J2B8_ARAVE|nr:hypothetical protein AVEN_143480-1 [Araneus ventricosus]
MHDVIGHPEERQATAIIRKGACMPIRKPRMPVLSPEAGSTVGGPGGVITVYQSPDRDKPAFRVIPEGVDVSRIGQRNFLSEIDKLKVMRLYCPEKL